MLFSELSNELKLQAKQCQTYEERMAFLAKNNIELSDEQLESISGGGRFWRKSHKDIRPKCPNCESRDFTKTDQQKPGVIFGEIWPDVLYRCDKCGAVDWRFM